MEKEQRIAKALKIAEMGCFDGADHKQWVIDQMVRVLFGCPEVTITGVDCEGTAYSYKMMGENEAYNKWKGGFYGWEVGIAP